MVDLLMDFVTDCHIHRLERYESRLGRDCLCLPIGKIRVTTRAGLPMPTNWKDTSHDSGGIAIPTDWKGTSYDSILVLIGRLKLVTTRAGLPISTDWKRLGLYRCRPAYEDYPMSWCK